MTQKRAQWVHSFLRAWTLVVREFGWWVLKCNDPFQHLSCSGTVSGLQTNHSGLLLKGKHKYISWLCKVYTLTNKTKIKYVRKYSSDI
jgi:hypothetical protein